MVMEWSTDSAPPAQRFEQWREACFQHVYALTPRRRGNAPFQGSIARLQLGSLDVTDIVCDGHLVQRREQDISERPGNTYYIYLQRRGRAWFEQQGRRCVAEPGDIVVADPNIAFRTGTEGRFDFRLWRIDRGHLEPLLKERRGELGMQRLARGQAPRALIVSWLEALLQHRAGLSPTSLDLACTTLCSLVADAGVPVEAEPPEPFRLARRRALLQRVMRAIELQADDADLNPERLANQFGLSLRSLHHLFEPMNLSFHEFLTRTRLRRAHRLLRDPSVRHVNTAEIGFTVGFRETSTFYRRFKQQYGETPGGVRESKNPLARPKGPAFP